MDKQDRLWAVNTIIQQIALKGRGFFYNEEHKRYAKMIIDKHKVYFVDDYTGKRVYAYNTVPNERRGFSHGGTIWGLINDFREFIVTGEHSNGRNGYGGLYCTHWGYPEEDMEAIRKVARTVGYLKDMRNFSI